MGEAAGGEVVLIDPAMRLQRAVERTTRSAPAPFGTIRIQTIREDHREERRHLTHLTRNDGRAAVEPDSADFQEAVFQTPESTSSAPVLSPMRSTGTPTFSSIAV